MSHYLALIVDDEPDIRELLEITLNRMKINTLSAENITSAKTLLQNNKFNLCLTDMKLPDGDGLGLVDYIQAKYSQLPVAVITAHGNTETAVKAMKTGAFDFLSKPVDLQSLRQLVNSALKLSTPAARERRSRDTLLGESEAMRFIRSKIAKVARSQAPVFISGESGSGKELVARQIHKQSPRNDQPFIAVNCGAIPHELVESEFFGHKKGSFTGAHSDKEGLFQAAEGGTLFLDEVGDLPAALQVKLLRAIQEKKIRQVGGYQEISTDVRILSATHQKLAKMVQEGHFRQDLFYRINVIELAVPPLRERREDIPKLAQHFLENITGKSGLPQPKLSSDAILALKQYPFPGNVRELENILERAIALFDGDRIEITDLNLPDLVSPPPQTSSKSQDLIQGSLENYLEEIERQAISEALEQNKWNKTATAKQLGLTFRSLRYRLKKLGLE